MIVHKFGGSSVGTGERITSVARIITDLKQRSEQQPIVVVRAP